jgi:hypothetical protein
MLRVFSGITALLSSLLLLPLMAQASPTFDEDMQKPYVEPQCRHKSISIAKELIGKYEKGEARPLELAHKEFRNFYYLQKMEVEKYEKRLEVAKLKWFPNPQNVKYYRKKIKCEKQKLDLIQEYIEKVEAQYAAESQESSGQVCGDTKDTKITEVGVLIDKVNANAQTLR